MTFNVRNLPARAAAVAFLCERLPSDCGASQLSQRHRFYKNGSDL